MNVADRDEGGTPAAFSVLRGDALFRVQQTVGLVPRSGGLGVLRRALLLAAVTWVPIVAWALATGRALGRMVAEPLFEHFGVHVRCLVAIPLFVIADATAHTTTTRLLPYFVTSGLVSGAARERFDALLRDAGRLRDRWLPWILMLGLVAAWTYTRPAAENFHELRWATEDVPAAPGAGFGGWWFLHVVAPVFLALLLAWGWRLVVLWIVLLRIARLDLSLVPTHPDRVGGLGFVDMLPAGFAPVVLAVSTVASSRWAHDVMYHDVALEDLRMPAAALVVVLALIVLGPLLAFFRPLARAKRAGLLEYGALVGEHGRRVRRRWILHEPVEDDAILCAPELGPVVDTSALYESVRQMRPVPIGTRALAAVVIPAVLPMLAVVAIRIPIKDLLVQLLKVVL